MAQTFERTWRTGDMTDMGRHLTLINMQRPKDSFSKLNKRCSLTEVLARLTANANVATVLRSVPAKRKTKRERERDFSVCVRCRERE